MRMACEAYANVMRAVRSTYAAKSAVAVLSIHAAAVSIGVAHAAVASFPTEELRIRFQDNLCSADIRNAPLSSVLDAIAAEAQLQVRFLDPEQMSSRVDASFGPTSLERALHSVLSDVSYVYYTAGETRIVMVLSSKTDRGQNVAILPAVLAEPVAYADEAEEGKAVLAEVTCQPCDDADKACTPC